MFYACFVPRQPTGGGERAIVRENEMKSERGEQRLFVETDIYSH